MSITAAEIGLHAQTKPELERLLRGKARAYLPAAKYVTIYHMRDLGSGDKKVGIFVSFLISLFPYLISSGKPMTSF
jgi:hypothetical protein